MGVFDCDTEAAYYLEPDHEYEEVPLLTSCRHCKAPGLQWLDTTAGWRLVDSSGVIHRCAEYFQKKKLK